MIIVMLILRTIILDFIFNDVIPVEKSILRNINTTRFTRSFF